MIRNNDKNIPSERIELKGMLAEFREALEDEIEKIEKSGQSSTILYSGRQIESHSSDLWYCFKVEYAPTLPADTPCKLLVGNEQFDVTVISYEENSIILATKTPLPDALGRARLENGATVLMELLIKCIENNAEKENIAGKRMLPDEKGEIYSSRGIYTYDDLKLKSDNTSSQNKAIISAVSNDITYIWGPPGTGKTTVIGQIIDELFKHNRSVLVVSHTNSAVDGAIEKADKTYSSTHSMTEFPYPILRLGTPVKKLEERVLLSQHISVLGKDLYEQKNLLEKQQNDLQNKINEIIPHLSKIAWINENKLEDVSQIIGQIIRLKSEIKTIQSEIEKINTAVEQEKAAHPEYANYLVISRKIKEKRTDYDVICKHIFENEKIIGEVPAKIQQSQDEIKKHSVYAELKIKESKFMSSSFLKNEITKIRERIATLNVEISALTAKQLIANQTIEEFEKKNSVAKLFSNKGVILQAQTTLQEVVLLLTQSNEELTRLHNLELEYSNQFEKLLLLQEQIKAVMPSESQEYWENKLNELQKNLSEAESILPNIQSQKVSMYDELQELEAQQRKAKASFDILSEYGRKIRQKHEQFEKTNADYKYQIEHCSELLEVECSKCASFSNIPTAETTEMLFTELSNLLSKVKYEVSKVDAESIKQEKEELDSQLIEIFRQLNEIKQKMQELEKQAIMQAKIVGTTLAKSYLSETLRERKFDTVILDEASMASIPALWCTSYLAESNIVIVGDFLQLPPIVMAETPMAKKWLGQDIFYHSTMQKLAKDKKCPSNFVMLNDQFRMESDIADIVNELYYGEYGGLISYDTNEYRVAMRESFYEWYPESKTKNNIHLIDTESLHAWVTGVPQGKSHSRLNCFSAAVDVDLAFKFLENKLSLLDPKTAIPEIEASVLIVAPYKPHIARINQLIDLEYRNRGFKENLNHIRAGTIHSFQGSEADIVIFDLVIDEPHWKANLFMTDTEINDDLRKMFNVAITRAKFKLYIVGNFAFCQKRARNNALSELLENLKKKNLPKIDAKKMLPNITFTRQADFSSDGKLNTKHIVCREDVFNDYFMSDIKTFKKRLIIYSPFMTEARLSVLLPAFVDAIKLGREIIIITKALADRGKNEVAQYRKCEKELQNIGVSILHKKGMHEKLIFIDSDVVWIGSLNALSFTGLTGEVMHRHADSNLTMEYEKLFDIEHIYGAIENAYEQKCPICDGEMLVKESDEGGIYWQCVEEDYSRNASQQYPLDGILRCKCGAPYVFAMKNEPRWICTEDPKHFQKMRESDLKLEKMAELIPTKTARKEVDRYFANKRKIREAEKKASPSKPKKAQKSKKSIDEFEQLTLF